jgi:hypothetical protein
MRWKSCQPTDRRAARQGLYLAAAARSTEAGWRAAAARYRSLLCRREEGRKKTFANIVLLRALPENSGLVSGGMVFQAMDYFYLSSYD